MCTVESKSKQHVTVHLEMYVQLQAAAHEAALKLNRDRFSHAVCKLTVCETMHEAASEAMSCRLSSR